MKLFTLMAISMSLAAVPGLAADADFVDYNLDIKPILSDRCYACHGPDAGQRQAELRLDIEAGAVQSAIVPGKASESELIKRIGSDDPDERMPPADSKKPPLTAEQVALFRRWVDQGAKFDTHWAYVPPTRPEVPATNDQAWPKNEIDRFILARLEAEGIAPSPAADRRTLARRLSFDLTGLPPQSDEVAAFQADSSDDAYKHLVDRLLDSPQYGERMAMYWLDLVRYADTNGIHGDNHRDHAPYRDYVIDAFNRNMPFDQFTIEQLAGDLLPQPTRAQRIASGYNRLNMTTREGGAQPKEYMAKYAADRVRNASSVWLGSTMGCSECHDHKFDPFTMKDFYSLASFFADVQETAVGTQQPLPVPTEDQLARVHEIEQEIAGQRKVLDTETPELAAAQSKWEESLRPRLEADLTDWVVIKPEKAESAGGATLKTLEENSVLSTGNNPAKDTYTVTLRTDLAGITGIRLEALQHESLPNNGLSRSNGNFVLTGFEVELALLDDLTEPIKIAAAVADYEQEGFPVAGAVDGKSDTGWAVDGHQKPANRSAVFTFEKPIEGGADTVLRVRLRHDSAHAQHNIGRFRLALTTAEKPALGPDLNIPADIAAILRIGPEGRTPEQSAAAAKYYRSIAPMLDGVRSKLAEIETQKKTLEEGFPKTLIAVSVSPREMRILPRGNWLDDSGEVVSPAVPEFLARLDVEGRASRMELADWIVDPKNPLTARVMVNRLWKVLFGRGIVGTLDDFGSQGASPTHPKLLDWLAVEFVNSGWDVKHMVRLMVHSSAYQQSSLPRPELRERDPTNRMLTRQNRFRLDAEMVRDNALAISGLLSLEIGGESVKPYQPAGYWSHLNFPKREYKHDSGENQYRRGLYTYWCRTFLHPSLLAFDAPSREECAVERPRSNTPLQALVLLNDPTYVEAARVFAQRIISEGGSSTPERLGYAIRQALAREPAPEEAAVLADLYTRHHEQYAQDPEAARQIATAGEWKAADAMDSAELAAWTSVARTILNLHETITRF